MAGGGRAGHGHPVAVGGNDVQVFPLQIEEDPAEHRQLGVGPDGEAYGVQRGRELRGGHGQPGGADGGGHGALLGSESGAYRGERAARIGELAFEPPQVPVQQPGHQAGVPAGPGRQDQPDVRERHPRLPEPGQQPGLVELFGRVPAVSGRRIHPGGRQDARPVVEAQRAHAQPAVAAHLANAVHLALHTRDSGTSTRSRVKAGSHVGRWRFCRASQA